MEQVTYGPASENGSRYTAVGCTVMDVNQTSMRCQTSSGVGSGHVWRVTVGGQVSFVSRDTTAYVPPTVLAVSGQGSRQAKTEGGEQILISGLDFGSAGDTVGKVVVAYGRSLSDHNCSYNSIPDAVVLSPSLCATAHDAAARFVAVDCRVVRDYVSIMCLTANGTGTGHAWAVSMDGAFW
jgi:hypothetical protein